MWPAGCKIPRSAQQDFFPPNELIFFHYRSNLFPSPVSLESVHISAQIEVEAKEIKAIGGYVPSYRLQA